MAQAPNFFSWLRRLAQFLRRENLHRILLVLLALSLLSAVGLWLLEGGEGKGSFYDWLWWSVVTLTTVGYGDITPSSPVGRLLGVFLMFSGIGILSMLTATIASFFVELRLRKERGMGSYNFKDHIILCQWTHCTEEVLRELRSDRRTAEAPIVLIAEIDAKPSDDENLFFVHGGVTEANLKRACIDRASTVVIVGDSRLEPNARDAQVVLAALTVETLNPDVYSIAEIVNEQNIQHCRRAKTDEIIVGHQLSSSLLASSAIDHGLSKVATELLSQRYGSDLRRVKLPESLFGKDFLDALVEMKRSNRAIAVAVQRNGEVITNPDADLKLEAGDSLIAIVDRD